MPNYSSRARDNAGKEVKGVINVPNFQPLFEKCVTNDGKNGIIHYE